MYPAPSLAHLQRLICALLGLHQVTDQHYDSRDRSAREHDRTQRRRAQLCRQILGAHQPTARTNTTSVCLRPAWLGRAQRQPKTISSNNKSLLTHTNIAKSY